MTIERGLRPPFFYKDIEMAGLVKDKISDLLVTKKLRMGKNSKLAVLSATGAETLIDLTELAALDSIAASDLAKIDGITNGTVAAGKAAVVDSNKDIGDFRNLDAVNFDAGASGTAGSVDVFPSTASKGKVSLTAANSAGDTTTTIVNASQSGARTYTIPDAGASASFVMTEGAQTINGTKTIPAIVTDTLSTTVEASEHGAGSIGTAVAPATYRWIENGVIITQIKFDLTGLASVATANDVIGLSAGGVAYIGRNVVATNGVIFKTQFACLETPAGGDNDVNVVVNSSAVLAYDSAGGTTYLSNSGDLLAGQTVENLMPAITANDYIYLTAGTGDTAATYTAGQYVLTLWGHALIS